ncbi:MAG: amino acid permease [Furfurilactobacillus sp.]|jgi:APA family basic amino acid/polyamine antiporter|uniref:Amino acid permease n=1 Tax=Furfurilactobacillus milii TaxID=2888272 RepID=A0ABT6DAZ1_9LACO|nr:MULTISPECIES: amino acid permease [Furfurilactobacillus]QLE66094.1 amino acid permease protein [Furfurilactobacillus rossiae]MCF6160807.1 amino acid permease [Furfurilactobacillus milii]MCF6162999.1 amino acid permease [Furfurilactobacillus milii]MCF6419708.1 amino acid permease [Furfurilactobacillus milii]MCH4012612.1 amino acid permease [Furfurilactobacillus sp.]
MAQVRDLFVKKDTSNDILKQSGLEKTLSAFNLTTMGVGAIVGAGIFITPGVIASLHAGPAGMLSFVLAAFVCALAALCYSEFSSTIPLAGSAYTYVYTVFGELVAWVLGWSLVSEYMFSVSSVATSWSAYFQNILAGFGWRLPVFLRAAPGTASVPGGRFDLIAFLIVMVISVLLLGGVHESARVNTAMVVLKIAVILLFIGVAVFYVKPANYHPFMPFGVGGVFKGAALAFYAYVGFDAVSSAAEEVKRPQRDMPIGISMSLVIASILYIALATVLVGIVKYTKLNVADPVAFALQYLHLTNLSGIISLGAIVGMTTVLLVMSYGGTRLIFAISRDGLLPQRLHKLSPKTHVPVSNTILFGLFAAVFAAFIPISLVSELVNIGTLFAFALVSLGVVFLRRNPDFAHVKAAFHVPLYPYLPILSFILCIGLMLMLQVFTWIAFVIWQAVGLTIYATYGYRHSLARQRLYK